jgi:hypothetical protein
MLNPLLNFMSNKTIFQILVFQTIANNEKKIQFHLNGFTRFPFHISFQINVHSKHTQNIYLYIYVDR